MMRFALPTVLLALLLLPLSAQAQPTVDGDLSDADYQTLATKQNANSGFGANIDVQEIVYYADLANDVLYLGVKGKLDTGSNNGIGLWLGFSEVAGVSAGTGLGFGGGGHYLGGNGGSNAGFTADFEVAYGFALNPGGGASNVFVDGASYVGGTPSGGFVGTIDQSGTATPNSGFFTGGAVTHAFNNGGGADQGYEVAIPFSELGITATGELSAFAFVASSTAFFADVTVPGDVTGGNPGFDVNFNTLPGGPYHGTAPIAVPTIDGDITDELWDLLDTNDGGPASGFGDQYITSLSAHDDADFLYLGVGGKLLTGNRILVFVDSEAGGFNLADFGRTDAPAGINNFNSGTTFDPGFAPDYVLVLGGPFGGDFFADFYTLSDAGGPNNFLAGTDGSVGTPGSAIGVQTPPNSSNQDLGFEVQIPKSLLGFEPTTNGVQFFAALIGDSGFLSNQFITPAGSGDGNFGGGAIDFGQATPDPVTYLAPTPPAVPTLLAPADNATGLDFDNVFFDWSDAANAASYDFQLSTDPAFGTLITDINLTPSEYTEPSLQSGTTYYWRVRSRNGQVTSAFASASFSTRQALPAPALQTPADGAMDVATEPTLTWSSVTGATRYAVQVATDPGFAAGDLVVDRDDVTTTSLPVGPLENNVTYYWRARAGDADGFGDWAAAFSFTTAPVSVGGIAFDGDFDEGLWELLDTNDGGPTPGFGPLHRINALYAAEDADNLFIGVAGSVTSGAPSNRILVFIDSRAGGFNVANFGRTDAPGGIAAFNSGTTFDDGFLPDYALVIGGPFGGNYFVDLYTLSSSGGPNTFLGGAPAPGLGGDGTVGANPTAEEDNVGQGFEVQIPRTVIDVEDGPGGNGIRLFAAYISDTGFLSNQFITPAGSNEGNYGGDAISFGTRPPDPVTFRAPLPTSPPGPVELVAPTGGEERSILRLGGLRWTAASQAASYEVEVYPAGAFPDGDPIYTPTPTGTSIPMIRSGPGNYVWRVRGVNQLGAGPWSDPGAFRIVVTVPEIPTFAAPSLIAPPDGATGLTPTVQLEWEDVGAPGYRVEVATTEDFADGTLVATAVIEQTTYLVTGLTPGQTYFWRVFSTGSGGTSAASATRSFTVGEGGPVPLTFDGQMTEDAWGAPLDTNEGGPEPGFGPDQRINALYGFGDAQYLYVGVSGRVTTDDVASNRILVFIDSEEGGFNQATFGRANTFAGGIQNFNSETTFDPGFAPDHVLSIGHDGATTYFFDLYTLSGSVNTPESGGPNLFLGSTAGDAGGADPDGLAAMPTSDGANRTDGFEVRLPRNVLGLSDDAPVQLFAVYTSDTGFLSNQFISPAGPDDGNFGDGPVDFGQAVPDPVTVAADQLDGSAAGDKATDTRPAAETPEALVLHGNYPNPFNPTTTIRFDLPEAATVRVEVLDVTGRRMLSVPGQSFAAGTGHRVTLDAGHLPSGLYLYRVVAEGATALHQQTGRMVLIK